MSWAWLTGPLNTPEVVCCLEYLDNQLSGERSKLCWLPQCTQWSHRSQSTEGGLRDRSQDRVGNRGQVKSNRITDPNCFTLYGDFALYTWHLLIRGCIPALEVTACGLHMKVAPPHFLASPNPRWSPRVTLGTILSVLVQRFPMSTYYVSDTVLHDLEFIIHANLTRKVLTPFTNWIWKRI